MSSKDPTWRWWTGTFFDEVPDILETSNLKLSTPRTSTLCRKCVRNLNVLQGSNLEMVDRGLLDSVPDVLET